MNYQEVLAAHERGITDGWSEADQNIVDDAWNEVKAKYPRLFDGRDIGTDVSPGWWPALIEAFEGISALLEQHPNVVCSILQIKEKFGTLRVYSRTHAGSLGIDEDGGEQFVPVPEDLRRKIHGILDLADVRTSKTCEYCGKPGERRNTGWIKTLCNDHYKIVRKKWA